MQVGDEEEAFMTRLPVGETAERSEIVPQR
jgi:hypothetical protein